MAFYQNDSWGQTTSDLSTLPYPDLHNVVSLLQHRFYSGQIFANIGDILVSVNPYSHLPLFGPQIGYDYLSVNTAVRHGPHIFTTACRAHRYIQLHNCDQGVLLTGESGSGKTECVKMLVSQLGRLSSASNHPRDDSDVAELLSQGLNFLDVFGNAETALNPNSSRFGKLVETYWDGKTMEGAEILVQGLEKNRVMASGPGERNFHIFYRLLAGFDEDMRRYHQLDQSYRILEPYEGGQVFRDRDDFTCHRESYEYLKTCLKTLGIDDKTFRSGRETAGTAMFEVLSALLHLGNVHFAPDPETDSAFIANPAEVEAAARLLGIPANDLCSLFLDGVSHSRGGRVRHRLDVGRAAMTRNATVRFLYQLVFHWLVSEVNARLAPTGRNRNPTTEIKTIGILDLPGYENTVSNSLEQLHHNLSEERLKHHVTDTVFRKEIDDLEQDGVKSHKIRFTDNFNVFDSFFNQERGLLRMIDEGVGHPEEQLVQTIKRAHSKSSAVVVDNTGKTFTVMHFNGQVTYNADSILAKNAPTSNDRFKLVLQYSRNPLLQEVTSDHVSREVLGVEDDPELTSIQKYATSSSNLFRRLEERELHHVWCIRPNMTSQSRLFDVECANRQAAAMNLVETAVIRSRGFPIRLSLPTFIDRYKFVGFALTDLIDISPGPCHRILRMSGLTDGGWEIRSRMVFMQVWHQDYVDTALERVLHDVIIVQSRVRGFVARQRYKRIRQGRQEENEELVEFFTDASLFSQNTFHACQTQNDHNIREMERRYRGDERPRRRQGSSYSGRGRQNEYYNTDRRSYNSGEEYMAYIETDSDDMATLMENLLRDVTSKRDLEPDIWAKVVSMEYDQPVGKFYVQEREITIDGSYQQQDGTRIGIGVFRNRERDRETEQIRGHLGPGLTLTRDSDGNIYARKLTKNDVIVQGHDDPANHPLSADVIMNRGQLPYNKAIKVFDMNEFRSRIGLELQSSTFNRERLLHQCVLGISLLAPGSTPLDTPCWLCVVNIVAINTVMDPEMIHKMEKMMAMVQLKSEKEELKNEKANEAKQRHPRNQWARTDYRAHLGQLEGSGRKMRIEMRKEGKAVGDHMEYTWNINNSNPVRRQMRLESLQESAGRHEDLQYYRDQGLSPTSPSERGSGWAKVRAAAKLSKVRQESEMDAMLKDKVTRY